MSHGISEQLTEMIAEGACNYGSSRFSYKVYLLIEF